MNKTDIINNTLILLGQGAVVEPSNEVIINKVYDIVKERLLRSHPWACAKKEYVIDHTLNDNPLFKYRYKYTIPSDCLRVIAKFEDDAEVARKGKFLFSDHETLKFTGICNINENDFTADLASLFAINLACECCIAYCGDKQLKEILNKDKEALERRVKQEDLKESSEEEIKYDCGWGVR